MDEATKEVIRNLWRSGETITGIGQKIGLTRNAVAGAIHRMRERGEDLDSRPSNHRVKKPRVMKVSIIKYFQPKLSSDGPVSLMQLTYKSCRFIVQEGDVKNTRYCNKDIWKQSYCEDHYNVCYVRPKVPATRLNVFK